eukprot:scaffold2510_cov169-Amphora_coffeaeformis.AAC.48
MSAPSSSSQPPRASEKLMVSLVDANLPLRHGQTLTLSKLACASQQTSLYLQVPRETNITAPNNEISTDATNYICEIQALPTDFGSFLVTPSNTVIGKDSNLYTTIIVDPLFLVLQQSDKFPEQWQPWDQIVETSMDATLRAVLPPNRNQLMHLFARMPIADDEVYYKFSTSKALAWLQKKFIKVQETLEQQQQHEASIVQSNRSGSGSGSGTSTTSAAMASTFVLGNQGKQQSETRESAAEQAKKRTAKQERLQQRCRADALQILCDYLNETWKVRFLQHVNLDVSLLAPPTKAVVTNKSSAAAAEKRPSSATDLALPPPKKPKVAPATTVGFKKLAKANTKGMQQLSAFFGVKKENVKNNKK